MELLDQRLEVFLRLLIHIINVFFCKDYAYLYSYSQRVREHMHCTLSTLSIRKNQNPVNVKGTHFISF